jgi:hypothetical protein
LIIKAIANNLSGNFSFSRSKCAVTEKDVQCCGWGDFAAQLEVTDKNIFTPEPLAK